MLALERRMRRRDEFTAAVRAGRRGARGGVVVHMLSPVATVAGPAPRSTRAGFIIPRAVGTAVTRNKVRRRVRHLLRDRLSSLPPGSSLVVRATRAATASSYRQLGSDLDAAIATALTATRQGSATSVGRGSR